VRILLLANSQLGADVAYSLQHLRENVVGLVVHPDETARLKKDIRCCHWDASVFCGDPFGEQPGDMPWWKQALGLKPDIGISAGFGYKVPKDLLDRLPIVNLHTGYLPYNRGACPNVWPIIDGTPAGVTLHWMDEGIDTGDIIAQERVDVQPWDTGETLHSKLLDAGAKLFQGTWPSIKDGTAPRTPQDPEAGTHRRLSDLDAIDEIDLGVKYTARDLLNTLRARTFLPHQGAYFTVPGVGRIYLRLEMETAEDRQKQRTGSMLFRLKTEDTRLG